jgi:DNA-binding MarR family transcriptional regulator/GNAT superfamily N-acetyltransferase
MGDDDLLERVEAARRFNRFYTRQIGALEETLLQSPFSLVQARVIYELAHADSPTATRLGTALGLDPGYLSRILGAFEKRGLVARAPSASDGRQNLLTLTEAGRAAFATLDGRSRDAVGAMLAKLPAADQRRVVTAMRTIEQFLGGVPCDGTAYLLRPHRPGDMGWIVQRHGSVYAEEFGFDETFEALVAEIAAGFIRHYDPRLERCWMAERNGEAVGGVLLVKHSNTVAKLRLLLVDPSARGLGIGPRLVKEAVGFARHAGYRKVTLWTQNILRAARSIYGAAGFRLVREEPHRSFGHDLVGEVWELRF